MSWHIGMHTKYGFCNRSKAGAYNVVFTIDHSCEGNGNFATPAQRFGTGKFVNN